MAGMIGAAMTGIVATFFTILLGIWLTHLFSTTVSEHSPPSVEELKRAPAPTRQEIEAATKRMEDKIEKRYRDRQSRKSSAMTVHYQARHATWSLTWLPWLLVGALVKPRSFLQVASLFAPLMLAMGFKLLLAGELLLCFVAACFGLGARIGLTRLKRPGKG